MASRSLAPRMASIVARASIDVGRGRIDLGQDCPGSGHWATGAKRSVSGPHPCTVSGTLVSYPYGGSNVQTSQYLPLRPEGICIVIAKLTAV